MLAIKRKKITRLAPVDFAHANKSEVEKEKERREQANQADDNLTEVEKERMKYVLELMFNSVGNQKEKAIIMKMQNEKWQDPTPNFIEGIFELDQSNIFVQCCCKSRAKTAKTKIFVYDYRALFCLHFENPIRIQVVKLTTSTMFENLVILLIFLNSIILAIYDYNDRDHKLEFNQQLEKIEKALTILFAIEMVLKILAQGFIFHRNAYLRDYWNWLDFIVVVTGVMEMMELSWFKVRALRTLRVLRPLRSIKAFPKMRQLISSLVGSVSQLFNAVVFMLFIFMLFGILGIQQFQNVMYQRCRYTAEPLPDGTWPFDTDLDYLCSPDGQGLMECPEDRFCRQPADANLPADIDNPNDQLLIFYNMMGFENLGKAMLTIFQMITLEQWTTVMYLLMDANIWWMAVLFCISLILIGSFFLLNVILAVLADALTMVEQVQQKQDDARLTIMRHSLDRAEVQKAKLKGELDNQKSQPSIKQNNETVINEGVADKDDLKKQESLGDDLNAEFIDKSDVNPAQSCTPDNHLSIISGNASKLAQPTASLVPPVLVRAQKNRIYFICYQICMHLTFSLVITILIVVNTIVLALEKYPEDARITEVSSILNEVFTWAFFVEMVIKLIGLGFHEYARDSFNLFDAFIVAVSMVDIIITATIQGDSPTGALSAFRGVRLLRIFKLARSWSSFRDILSKIGKTAREVSTFSILLLMFMFIFSLLGMELFGYKVQFLDGMFIANDNELIDQAQAPRPNFNNLAMGFTSIFAVAIGDDWNYLMAMNYRAEGLIAVIFYPILFIFMNLILLNLFLAILLMKFEGGEQPDTTKQDKLEERALTRLQRRLKRCCVDCWNRFFSCCKVQDNNSESIIQSCSQMSSIENENGFSPIKNKDFGGIVMQAKAQLAPLEELPEEFGVNIQNSVRRLKTFAPASRTRRLSSFLESSRQSDKSFSEDLPMKQVSIPGNQQGTKAAVSETIDQNVIQENEPDVKFQQIFQSQRLGTSVRSKMRQQQDSIAQTIPKEYQPKIFRKILQSQGQTKNKRTYAQEQKLQDLKESQMMICNETKHMSLAQMKKMELIERYGSETKNVEMIGRSLFMFSKENCLRNVCYRIVTHVWYDTAVLIFITSSTVMLTIDNPNMDGKGSLASVLRVFDIVLTSLFTLECLINIILFGLFFNGKSSYARDPWNVMDLIIVLFSLLTLVLQGSGDELSVLKIFRMLRVLRPLRFLKRNLGLKIQVISLINAIPGIANLLLIATLILMIFGIQAVATLKGTFFYCDTANVPDYAVADIMTKWDCSDYGGDWVNQESNFDNVLNSMITMFGMMSTEGWLEIMWSAVDANNIHQVPRRNNSMVLIVFFSFFMVAGSLFILNLFVGVVINTFNIEKEKLSRNQMMTILQNEYVEVLIKCYSCRPLKAVIETGNRYRDSMSRLAQHPAFEIFIFVCICCNTVVLAIKWYDMNQEIIDVLEILNYMFTVVYTIEMIVKMAAFGKGYFKDGWCLFDFIIVLSAWIGIILLQVFDIDVGSVSTIIRSFRIARVLKLIKTAKQLQQIFQTFIIAIPELVNVGALLMLFLFLFSVLGVSLFAEVKLQETMDRHANFEHFGFAILTLLRVATGENWIGIMQDAARSPSILFQCMTKDQSYESKQKDGIQGCGNPAAYAYFVAYIVIVSLVFLNLFIAIILEGFAASAQEQKNRVGEECFEAFQRVWRKYDPKATEFIEVEKLEELLMDLICEELKIIDKDGEKSDSINFNLRKFTIKQYTKWKRNMIGEEDRKGYFKEIERLQQRKRAMKTEMRTFISRLQIPLYDRMRYVQFHDTLNGIIGRVYGLIQENDVKDTKLRIDNKNKLGEELVGNEGIEKGSEEFWTLRPLQQEKFLECTEIAFQQVVNRLENKGKVQGESILKLSFMRRLRKKAGLKSSHLLSIYKGPGKEQEEFHQSVFDSSHIMGARTIERMLIRKRKLKKEGRVNLHHMSSMAQITSQKADSSILPPIHNRTNSGSNFFCEFGVQSSVTESLLIKDDSSTMLGVNSTARGFGLPVPIPEEMSPCQSIEIFSGDLKVALSSLSQANTQRVSLEDEHEEEEAEIIYGGPVLFHPQTQTEVLSMKENPAEIEIENDEQIESLSPQAEEVHISSQEIEENADTLPEIDKKQLRLLQTTQVLLAAPMRKSQKLVSAGSVKQKLTNKVKMRGQFVIPPASQLPKTLVAKKDQQLNNAADATIISLPLDLCNVDLKYTGLEQDQAKAEHLPKSRKMQIPPRKQKRQNSITSQQHSKKIVVASPPQTQNIMWFKSPVKDQKSRDSELFVRRYSDAKPISKTRSAIKSNQYQQESQEDQAVQMNNRNQNQSQTQQQQKCYHTEFELNQRNAVSQMRQGVVKTATKLRIETMGHMLHVQPITAGIKQLREQLTPTTLLAGNTLSRVDLQDRLTRVNMWNRDRAGSSSSQAHPMQSQLYQQNFISPISPKSNTRRARSKKTRKIMDSYNLI